MSEKILRFMGKKENLGMLSGEILQNLNAQGYTTQINDTNPMGIVIQAQKAGILRDVIDADRAFTILIAGKPNDFTVHIGIGKFVQNLAVAGAEALLLSGLFLAVDVPEMLWTKHVENGLAKDITGLVHEPKWPPEISAKK